MYAPIQSMNPLETYQSDAMERPLIRRRLFWALVVSLLIHLGVVYWFHQTHLAAQFNAPVERLVPRIFSIKKITIDEGALDREDKEEAAQKADMKPAVKPLDIPDEKPVVEPTEGRMAPSAPATPDFVKPLASEKPIANTNDIQAIVRVQESAAKVMEQDLQSLNASILKDQPANPAHPTIKLPESAGGSSTQNDSAGMAAASGRLDALLGHGLHSGDAPVTLPGGALFQFASADLSQAPIEQLRKLGLLIKQNPNVTFSIEGYTDSFGDAAYNQQLSQDRADAVRTWLIQNMDVDPAHIQAIGYGATLFIVRPQPVDMHSQASIDKEKILEQPNRRVEIRFKFPKAK
jgi:outer membrane protein OmpA-like peptidoglycan-associated protein